MPDLVIDIDSHFEPGPEWLEPYPDLAKRLPKLEPARLAMNTASVAEIALLPGIGPARARDIVRTREHRGGLAGPEDLLEVPGIGPAKLDSLRERVRVG